MTDHDYKKPPRWVSDPGHYLRPDELAAVDREDRSSLRLEEDMLLLSERLLAARGETETWKAEVERILGTFPHGINVTDRAKLKEWLDSTDHSFQCAAHSEGQFCCLDKLAEASLT